MRNRSMTWTVQFEDIICLKNGIVDLNPAQDWNVYLHFPVLSWVTRSFVMG
jgi:hypothetical protein